MKLKFIAGATAIAGLCFAVVGTAQAREFADIYTECGIGAMIAPNNEAVAAVTNVTWDLGTTAISSNASSEDTCEGGKEKSAALIYQAYPNIEKDIANGHGEHLAALLHLAGVANDDYDAVIGSLRPGFSALVGEAGYGDKSRVEKAEALYNLLHASI